MKTLVPHLLHFLNDRSSRVNVITLLRFLAILVILVIVYSILFHEIMEYEGRSKSWITGVYWTLTTMSTLGFGDITFDSDLGKIFSTVVLMSGVVFLLILLPFTFIEFFYAPWMKAQQAARAPTRLSEDTSGHVILTWFDAVTKTLIEKLNQYQYPYVLLVTELTEALQLYDLGYKVMLGDLDNPETYRRARADQALMVASTASDQVNANVAFTVRDISEKVPIIATADLSASVDILQLAGCSYVLQLGEMMGQVLARQVSDGETMAHIIGRFDDLLIAEATARGTPLVGKTLKESRIRELTGANVLGIWARGSFQTAAPDTCIDLNSVLVLGGSEEHIKRYNELFYKMKPASGPIVIIGGGRVGMAVAHELAIRELDYRIIEKAPENIRDADKYIVGDGAELEILERAGIRNTPTVIITTHDDDMNIYLTIYCRRLRADAQIISRAGLERNVATLHRAGADFVLSYASTGATAIVNLIGRDSILMLAEGLDVFEVEIPETLIGKTIAQCDIRKRTGCTVIALHLDSQVEVMPDPHHPLPAEGRIILIGVPEAEERFLKLYKGNGA
jgi:voltage-gated potassium channel